MGGVCSSALAWRQKEKEFKIAFMGMLPTKESRLPLDNEHFKTIVMGTVAKKCKIVTRSLTEAWNSGGRRNDRPARLFAISFSDGIIFMVDHVEELQREEARRYVSGFLEGDLCRAEELCAELSPFLFVIYKKGDLESDRDETDEFARYFGLNDTTKAPWKIVVCDSDESENLLEGLKWMRNIIAHRKTKTEVFKAIVASATTLTENHGTTLLQKVKHIIFRSPGGQYIITGGHQLLYGGLQLINLGHLLLCGGFQLITRGHQLLCGGH